MIHTDEVTSFSMSETDKYIETVYLMSNRLQSLVRICQDLSGLDHRFEILPEKSKIVNYQNCLNKISYLDQNFYPKRKQIGASVSSFVFKNSPTKNYFRKL